MILPFISLAQNRVIYLDDLKENRGPKESINTSEPNLPLIYNIESPSLTVYTPETSKANGTGIVVAPGGGFMFLSIKSEGTEVAEWLVKKGFTVFLLKYRTFPIKTNNPTKELMDYYNAKKWEDLIKNQIPICVEDGRKALKYVRNNAAEFHLNSNKIGIIGFSAGGTVAASTAFAFDSSDKPNFVAPIYPYFPDSFHKSVLSDSPPMFIMASSNDEGGFAYHCLSLYKQWLDNNGKAELHLYINGGHGFGMRKQNLPNDTWIERFYEFLKGQGFY
jgi:acetyl esterase/lipase